MSQRLPDSAPLDGHLDGDLLDVRMVREREAMRAGDTLPEGALWGHEIAGLSMQDLLDDDELGERVTWALTAERFVGCYATEKDREWSMLVLLAARLHEAGVPESDPRIQRVYEVAQALDAAALR